MSVLDYKHVHCIGVGGIGVSAIARFFLSRGARVSGSDEHESDILNTLRERGVTISIGHSPKNMPKDVECVVYSPAVPADNPELVEAQKTGVPLFSYPQFLGELTALMSSIAVSGTNGKTTTTAILGKLLEAGGFDPTVVVGGRVDGWDENLRVGKGDVCVVEGCEYKRAMLHLSPHIVVLTNIEEDHLDYYKDLEDIVDAFSEYVAKLTEDDILIYNADDENVNRVSKDTVARAISFGVKEGASVRAKDIVVSEGKQHFTLEIYEQDVATLTTSLPGLFNIYNILGAVAVAIDMGVEVSAIQKALEDFAGTWRRFETVGTYNGTVIISDYAHHPTAIKGTLKAARDLYHGKKVLAVFQPHHEDRTVKLFDNFVESFADADEVIISEIYHVAGREGASRISSKDLARAIEERGGVDAVTFAKDVKVVETLIKKKSQDFDVVLIMGAGDIDSVAREISN